MTLASTNQPPEFQKFESLARRILTTPKAELMKHSLTGRSAKPRPKKRK